MPDRDPIAIDVVWRRTAPEPHPIAVEVFRSFAGPAEGSPASRMGMPVRFVAPADPDRAPLLEDLSQAQRRVVVIVIDDALVHACATNAAWAQFLDDLGRLPEDRTCRVTPIAVSASWEAIPALANKVNVVRAAQLGAPDQGRAANAGVNLAALHLLSGGARPGRVFLSYASADGAGIVAALAEHLRAETYLDVFRDVTSIHPADLFEDVIGDAAQAGPLVAVHTDAYAASVWCGREVLTAKHAGQPVVVLDAGSSGHDRSFPYLGNGPVVRYDPARPDPSFRRVSDLLLTQLVRRRWFPARVERIARLAGASPPECVLACPPELATLVAVDPNAAATVVYPDPPLARAELDLLAASRPGLTLLTPTQLWAS